MTGILPIGLAPSGPNVAAPSGSTLPVIRAGAAAGDLLAGTELGAILKQCATAAAADTIASERKRREAVLADAVEHVLEGDLLREITKLWPDEATMQRYTDEYKQFVSWCRARGVGWMPAASTTVAGYLLDRTMVDEINIDAALEIVDAISFAHDCTSNFLDRTPVNATIQFLRRVGDELIGVAVEASDSLVKPPMNGGNGAANERH
jgi:hypothetical protein